MTETPQQWQATMWTGDLEESIAFYGATLAQLGTELKRWLAEHQPQQFANAPVSDPDRLVYTTKQSASQKRVMVIYEPPENAPTGPLWYRSTNEWDHGAPLETAASTFLLRDLDITPGPGYQETATRDGALQLHLIKMLHKASTERQEQIEHVNTLLRRGWYILRMEEAEEKHWLLLGHPEEAAF